MSEQPNTWRDLLPCPFCGGEESDSLVMNQDIYEEDEDGPEIAAWYVDCIECGANCGAHCDEAGAVENWNQRADTDTVALRKSRAGTVYLAGPMTGIEDYNYPEFHQSAASLKARGFTVTNPADHGIVEGAEWGDYVRHDLGKLAACEKLALMPGWEKSKGARLEKYIADTLGMETIYLRGANQEANPAGPTEVWLGKADKLVADIYDEPRTWAGIGIFTPEVDESRAIGQEDGLIDGKPIEDSQPLILIKSTRPESLQVLVHELQQAIARMEGK